MLPSLFSSLLSHGVSHVYPAFRSYRVISRGNNEETRRWLIYWTVLGAVHCVEYVTDTFIFWFPFYDEAKLLLRLWLVLPEAQGSLIIYQTYLRPYFAQHERRITEGFERIQRDFGVLVQEGMRLGLGRLFELFTKFGQDFTDFIARNGQKGEGTYSDFEDIPSNAKVELVDEEEENGKAK